MTSRGFKGLDFCRIEKKASGAGMPQGRQVFLDFIYPSHFNSTTLFWIQSSNLTKKSAVKQLHDTFHNISSLISALHRAVWPAHPRTSAISSSARASRSARRYRSRLTLFPEPLPRRSSSASPRDTAGSLPHKRSRGSPPSGSPAGSPRRQKYSRKQ